MDPLKLPEKDADGYWVLIDPVYPLTIAERREFDFPNELSSEHNISETPEPKSTQIIPPQFAEYFIQNYRKQFYSAQSVKKEGVDEMLYDRKIEILEVKNEFPDMFLM